MTYKVIIPAALAVAFGAAGLAQAQGTSTSPATAPTGAPATTAPTSPATATPMAPTATPSTPSVTAPRTSSGAPITSGTHSATNNAVNTKPANNPGAPVAGANSFTQGQARSRIQHAGFKQVTGLKLDKQGVWRGKAQKDGASVDVSMDYQGNVVSK